MIQNFWISPRGEEHPVPNHTSWLEQAFKTKLPPMDDVEHEIEKNKLYDWAYRMNWMRAQLDYGRRALYVDPDPQTGDHWRWLARQGARNHLLIYNSDGKELGNFQPGKHKKQQESLDPKKFMMGEAPWVQKLLDRGYVKDAKQVPGMPSFDKKFKYHVARVFVNEGIDVWWEVAVGRAGGFETVYTSYDLSDELLAAVEQIADTEPRWQAVDRKIKALKKQYESSNWPTAEARLITRLQLGLGPENYIREVLDIKQFIMDQPDLFTYKYGERIWAVAARKPVPKGAEFKHHLSYAEVLAFIHEQPDGTYRLANFCPDNRLNSRFLRMDDMRRKRWTTREAAANDIWAFSQRLKVESETPSVKNFIMNLSSPRARDVEYRVKAVWNALDTSIYGKFKTLEKAHLHALSLLHASYQPQTIHIYKVYKPSNTVLFNYRVTQHGGLVWCADLSESVDSAQAVVRSFKPEDQPAIDGLIFDAFRGMLPDERLNFYARYHDPPLTLVATIGDKVVGCYLLKANSVLSEIENEGAEPKEDLSRYRNLRGVEGVALVMLPEYRGTGIGKKLIDASQHLDFDYIWGSQLERLSNLSHWLKRRRLVAVHEAPPRYFVTLQDLKTHAVGEALDAKKEMLNLLVPEETLKNLGFKPAAFGCYVKGPFSLSAPVETKYEYGDAFTEWTEVRKWKEVMLEVHPANMGWELYYTLIGTTESHGTRERPVTSAKHTLSGFPVYAIAHWDYSEHVDMPDSEWPISGGMDFITPLRVAVKMLEDEIPNITQERMTVGGWEDFRQSLIKRLEAALPKSYPKPQQESAGIKSFILKNAGGFMFYIAEYVVNTRDDKETRPLRVWVDTEIPHDEAKARQAAVNLAIRATRPGSDVVRVEFEKWNIPVDWEKPATLESTYWVKADGTFEKVSGPADPTRAQPPG